MLDRALACFISCVLGVAAPCQVAATADKAAADKAAGKNDAEKKAAEKKAFRFVRFLELPKRRAEAMAGLIRLGSSAVRPLGLALNDPRPEIVNQALFILAGLGEKAKPALPQLEKMIKGADRGRALAAFRARSRIRPTNTTWVITSDKLIEITADGKQSDRLVQSSIWDAEPLLDGHMLVTRHSTSTVTEYDEKGKAVWSYSKLKNPMDADRLPNGNTLIADTQGHRVIEVNRAGKIVWKFDKGIRPNDADRLPDGNTLITHAKGMRVLEVDPRGKVVWELKEQTKLVDSDRLPNGNTLVTSYDRKDIREVDPKGKTVWRFACKGVPRDADRLPNGNTLVIDETELREIDAKGKEVRSFRFKSLPHEVFRF